MWQHYTNGFLLSLTMIVAIGAQNIFVIRNGIAKNHIFFISFICFFCDIVLMTVGVFGIGSLLQKNKTFALIIALCGSLFLLYYAFNCFKSVFRQQSNSFQLQAASNKQNLYKTVRNTLLVTLLNPSVYFDTVVIVGGIGSTLLLSQKYYFLLGALTASGIWFFSLGYGASLATKLFVNKKAVATLDLVMGIILLIFAFSLFRFAWLQV